MISRSFRPAPAFIPAFARRGRAGIQDFEEPLDSRVRGNECARKGRYISMVKVHAGVCHNSVAEGNCVAARRGGEQPEANCRSVG